MHSIHHPTFCSSSPRLRCHRSHRVDLQTSDYSSHRRGWRLDWKRRRMPTKTIVNWRLVVGELERWSSREVVRTAWQYSHRLNRLSMMSWVETRRYSDHPARRRRKGVRPSSFRINGLREDHWVTILCVLRLMICGISPQHQIRTRISMDWRWEYVEWRNSCVSESDTDHEWRWHLFSSVLASTSEVRVEILPLHVYSLVSVGFVVASKVALWILMLLLSWELNAGLALLLM